jgi:Flp pilus assembly protein TadG
VPIFPSPSPCKSKINQAQAVVEFALILPVLLLLTLGLIDMGRALVFGVAVQEGTRQAARVAATLNYDPPPTAAAYPAFDQAVLGRLIAASNPAVNNCLKQTGPQTCDGTPWAFTVRVDPDPLSACPLGPFPSLAAAHGAATLACPNVTAGAKVTITAVGSVALLPGVSLGSFGLVLPQITVHGESAMVIL